MNKRYHYIADKLRSLGIKRGNVLDCGCGEGRGAQMLQDRGFKVKGIDLNIKRVKKSIRKSIQAQEGDILNLPCEDESYDIFVCSETLEHLTRDESKVAAEEIMRVCKDSGIICITVPEDKKKCLAKPGHKQYLSYDDLVELFTGWTTAFKGRYCKSKGRCNRVVFFKKG